MALTLFRTNEHSPFHGARRFDRLPGPFEAADLLSGLATAPCPFAPASADRPIALYGAGNLGRLARDFLAAVGLVPAMVIDRNARQMTNDANWSGLRLLHPDDVTDSDKRDVLLAVCVTTSPYVPIERSLFELGFDNVSPFYDLAENFRHLHPLSNGWFAAPLSASDQANTATVLARWDDGISRAHHLQFLAWRRLREEWTFEAAPAPDCDRFLIPEITGFLRGDEILLDGGAHHGVVARAFAQQTEGSFRQIVAIEPDPANRARLDDELLTWMPDDPRITVLDCALAEHDGEGLFHDGLGYASQLSDTGTMPVATRRIDALGVAPTFIKLHLEGTELAALKGGRHTLLSSRPAVAVTVYHNADGIWRTPLWLMETLPGYRFLFRAHSWCGTGAVVYAIPQERIG